jgi:hypothetical protein
MEKIYNFNLDFMVSKGYPKMEFIKGDVAANRIVIKLTKNNEAVDLTGKNVTVTIRKADNTSIIYNANVTGADTVEFIPDANALAIPGAVYVTIEVYENIKRLTSIKFLYFVLESLNNSDDIASFTDYPILTKLISDVQVVEDKYKSNESTRAAAELTRQETEAVREGNETERLNNEGVRRDNESLRQAAEAARESNEEARQASEVTRENNEATREANETIRQNNEAVREENEAARIARMEELEQVDAVQFKSRQDQFDEYLADITHKTAITLSHQFTDNTARDAYFVAHPTELVENLFIKVGTGYQQYLNSVWESSSPVLAYGVTASDQPIVDAGNKFTASNVEDALQEVATLLDDKVAIYDTFNRADGAIGKAETGETWSFIGATGTSFAIESNLAKAGDVLAGAMVVPFQKDGVISVKMPILQTANGIAFRYQDYNNLLAVYSSSGAWKLIKRVSGTYTDVASLGASANNDVIRVSFNNSVIRLYINGNLKVTALVSDHKTQTKCGLLNLAGTTSNARWDDFKLEVL